MSKVAIRFSKRRASWDPSADLELLRNTEFKDREGNIDLRPSIYEVMTEEIVQTLAEHAAAAPIDPPRTTIGVDLSDLGFTFLKSPGNDAFRFTRQQHREIDLDSVEALDRLISLAYNQIATRKHVVKDSEVHSYAKKQLASEDPEWVALSNSPRAKTWLKKAR